MHTVRLWATALLSVTVLLYAVTAAGVARAAEPAAAQPAAATGTAEGTPGADPAPGGPAAPPPSEVGPLGAAEVPVAAKKALNRLRHLENVMQPGGDAARIDKALPPVAAYLADLKSLPAATRPEDLPPRQLVDAEMRWRRHEAELDAWQRSLERRVQELEAAAAELRATRGAWEGTRAAAVAAEAPAALLEQVDAVLHAIAVLHTELAARFDRVVTIQGRVGELVDLIDGVVTRIEDVRRDQDRRLYRSEAPSFLTALRQARPGTGLGDQIRQTRVELRTAAREFLETYGRRLPWHAAAFLLVVLVLAALGRATRRLEGTDPGLADSLAAARNVLDRPVSSAFILALFLARPFYPLAPPPVFHGLMVLALVPVLRLLPRIVWPEMRGPLYGLVLLVGLRELSMVAAEGMVLQRLLLLAVSLVGAALAARVGAPRRPAAARQGGMIWRAVIIGTRLSVAVFLAAVLANLTGRVWLADRLAGATVLCAYVAVLLFAGVLVLDGVTVVALRQAGARVLASVRHNEALLRRRVRQALDLVAIAWWVSGTLGAFRIREPVLGALHAAAAAPLEVGSLRLSLGDLMTFVAAIVIAVVLSRFVRFILAEDVLPPLAIEAGVRPMILMLVHYVIVGLGVIFGIAAAGFPVDRLTLVISALGVGIGFGLQGLVNNFVSGLSLIFERPIRIGDQVQVGTLLGRVESIGLRATILRTVQGSEVVVPNADLVSKEVTNWTLSDRLRRIEIGVGVAYGTDPQGVIDLLIAAARAHPDVLPDPAPIAVFQKFGESSLDFALRFWTIGDERWVKVESDVRVAVCRALGAAGIVIPFPQRDLHVVSVDAPAREVLVRPTSDASRRIDP